MRAVLDDWTSAPVDDRLRAALALIVSLNDAPASLDREPLRELRAHGVSRGETERVVQVSAAFHMIARIADALEFDIPPDEDFHRGAVRLLAHGYHRGAKRR